MINGNVSEFVDHIHYGDELVFTFRGRKFFLQGLSEQGVYTLYLDRWDPPSNEYLWVGKGKATITGRCGHRPLQLIIKSPPNRAAIFVGGWVVM